MEVLLFLLTILSLIILTNFVNMKNKLAFLIAYTELTPAYPIYNLKDGQREGGNQGKLPHWFGQRVYHIEPTCPIASANATFPLGNVSMWDLTPSSFIFHQFSFYMKHLLNSSSTSWCVGSTSSSISLSPSIGQCVHPWSHLTFALQAWVPNSPHLILGCLKDLTQFC